MGTFVAPMLVASETVAMPLANRLTDRHAAAVRWERLSIVTDDGDELTQMWSDDGR